VYCVSSTLDDAAVQVADTLDKQAMIQAAHDKADALTKATDILQTAY
jgi:hypothetical protein